MAKPTSEALRQRILALWTAGRSSGQVAEELNMTRSAVLGLLHRLRKEGVVTERAAPPTRSVRRAAAGRPPKTEENWQTREIVIIPKQPAVPRTPPGAYKLTELGAHSCRWPVRELGSGRFLFCGAGAESQPYCEEHRERAYTKPAVPLRKVRQTPA